MKQPWSKIISLEVLVLLNSRPEGSGQGNFKLVLACGCFDFLHIGHVRHLQAAARLGHTLAVLLTPNAYVNKGSGRPIYDTETRADMLSALACVDHVCYDFVRTGDIDHDTIDAICRVKPHFFVKGSDCKGRETPGLLCQQLATHECSGKFVYTETDGFHTSDLITRIKAL